MARRAVWYEELKQNSAQGSHWSQERGRSPAKHRKYMPIVRLVTSDCPSVCGWNAELMSSLTPARRNSSAQKLLVKTGSRSLTMDVGKPWRRTMSVKNARATDAAV